MVLIPVEGFDISPVAVNSQPLTVPCADFQHRRLTSAPAVTKTPSHWSRGVAQSGSALASGARGRWFKSSRPDQSKGRTRI